MNQEIYNVSDGSGGVSEGASEGTSEGTSDGEFAAGYSTWLEQVKENLDGIQAQGQFAHCEVHRWNPSPGLQVGHDAIPLPLVPRDAETIKSHCQQAPFERKDQTVVDLSVRKHGSWTAKSSPWETQTGTRLLVRPSKGWQQLLACGCYRIVHILLCLLTKTSFWQVWRHPMGALQVVAL
jgi:hypothetical protein